MEELDCEEILRQGESKEKSRGVKPSRFFLFDDSAKNHYCSSMTRKLMLHTVEDKLVLVNLAKVNSFSEQNRFQNDKPEGKYTEVMFENERVVNVKESVAQIDVMMSRNQSDNPNSMEQLAKSTDD